VQPETTDFEHLAWRMRVLDVAVGGASKIRQQLPGSKDILKQLRRLYSKISDARLSFMDRTMVHLIEHILFVFWLL
jgi:hypothetical protein